MSPRRKKDEITYHVGQRVFVDGSHGTVESINDDGTYTVRMAWGELVTAWPSHIAGRY